MSLTRRDLNWADVFPGWNSGSSFGGSVKALRLVSVYASVSLIADTFAMIPQYRYKEEGGIRRRMDLPAWLQRPDPRMLPIAWRYQFSTSLKLRGNAYGLVIGAGSPMGLRWLNPDRVTVDESDSSGPRFYVEGRREPLTLWSQGGQIVHVAEFVQPGSIIGLSPIAQFKQVWETAHHAVAYGHDWFEKSGVPAALLTAKTRLKEGDAAEATRLFKQSVAENGLATLDTDWDYKTLTIAPNEAQFLETIKASATMVANIFRVPAEEVGGETGSTRSYGNREADAARFNDRTMRPHGERYREAMNELLPRPHFIGLEYEVLQRPSLVDQVRADSEALRTGQKFHDEVRLENNRPPATQAQLAFWQENYQTQKTLSETVAEAVDDSIKTKQAKEE